FFLDAFDRLVDQRHTFVDSADSHQALRERDLELCVSDLVMHCMEVLEAVLKAFDPGLCIATTDGEDAFVGVANAEIGGQGIGFGVWNQPISVLFRAPKIADEYEYAWSPAQSDGKRYGIAAQLGVIESPMCLPD